MNPTSDQMAAAIAHARYREICVRIWGRGHITPGRTVEERIIEEVHAPVIYRQGGQPSTPDEPGGTAAGYNPVTALLDTYERLKAVQATRPDYRILLSPPADKPVRPPSFWKRVWAYLRNTDQ